MYDSTYDTMLHKNNIKKVLGEAIHELEYRMMTHDNSKLESPEKETYDTYIPLLKKVKYGTAEYDSLKKTMAENGLNHHFKMNSHHPEHYENGIIDMDLFSLFEMFWDWYAASLRSDTGFKDGLENNIEKYKIDDQIASIMRNTYDRYIEKKNK